MKFLLSIIALAVVGASAQSSTTLIAKCGTDCPTTVSDKLVTRTKAAVTESTPCPSFAVTTSAGYNGTMGGSGSGAGMAGMGGAGPAQGSGASPSSPAFTGAAAKVGSMGVAIAAGAGAAILVL